MNTTKHTPGPWNLEQGITHMKVWGTEAKTGPKLVAEVRDDYNGRQDDRANAHLIAAAPAMYEALSALLHYVETPGDFEQHERLELIADASIALAQAEGK